MKLDSKKGSWVPAASMVIGGALIGVLAALVISALKNKAASQLVVDSRRETLSKDEMGLAVPVSPSVNGWTLYQFSDYACIHCRKAETTTVKEMLESAPNIGRSLFFFCDPRSETGDWAARSIIAQSQMRPQFPMTYHKAYLSGKPPTEKEVLKNRPPDRQLEKILTKEAWRSEILAPQITSRLKGVRKLGERLGLQGVPAYMIVNQSGQGYLVGHMEDWYKLVKKLRLNES